MTAAEQPLGIPVHPGAWHLPQSSTAAVEGVRERQEQLQLR